MNVLSVLFFMILIMVAYSCGATIIVGRGRAAAPGLADLGGLSLLWILGISTQSALGKGHAMLVWLPTAVLLGSCLTRVRLESLQTQAMPPETARRGKWWRSIWEGWKSYATRMGNYQGRMMLAVVYFAVITPWGLIVRFFSDPLQVRSSSTASFWIQREALQADMEESKRQF